MTKKLIDRLEELADEMKVIVHQLRGPSTVAQEEIDKAEWQRGEVEGVIEFEGRQYKKVDREAREGDVIVFTESEVGFVTAGKTYKAIGRKFIDDDGDEINIYHGMANGSTETVDVYELIVEDKSKIRGIAIEINAPKSANQQRAEVIEKAKAFINSLKTNVTGVAANGSIKGQRHTWTDVYSPKSRNGIATACYVEFIVVEEKCKVVALLKGVDTNKVHAKGIAKCMPTDVFNEHIGKAIALGRALELDVSEFENAVQPTKLAEGQNIKWDENDSVFTFERFSNRGVEVGPAGFFTRKTYDNGHLTIINDTNAEYGGAE